MKSELTVEQVEALKEGILKAPWSSDDRVFFEMRSIPKEDILALIADWHSQRGEIEQLEVEVERLRKLLDWGYNIVYDLSGEDENETFLKDAQAAIEKGPQC